MMLHQSARASIFALLVALLLASCGTLSPPSSIAPVAPPVAPAPMPSLSHIFVIVLENKSYDQALNGTDAPYLSTLAHQYGLATNYTGITHPSLPNYIALTGGSTFGITSDCTDCFVNAANLVDQLEDAGKTWKAYMESMPRPCFVGNDGDLYRQRHNPFIYYDDIRTNPKRCNQIVPFTQFAQDLQANALPNFVWITPNMCDDAHDCALDASDTWLKTWVPQILASSAWKDRGALFITFDEGDHALTAGTTFGGGRIATVVLSPLGKAAYQSPLAYSHYALLRTIEDAWHLQPLNEATHTPPMSDFFTPSAATGS
jgi:phospholipase C